MGKIKISSNAFVYPMPVVIIGSVVENKENYMTAAWVSRINPNPALIAVAVAKNHHSSKGIHEHKEFSLNIPTQRQLEIVDFLGLNSGKNIDKSKMFKIFQGELKYAPMIEECPLTMECRVTDIINLPVDELIIAEISGAYSEKKYLTGNNPDIKKISPFVLTMPDNKYWSIGECLGNAWSVGKDFKY